MSDGSEILVDAAYERGREWGKAHHANGRREDAPLSGQWAGESISEIMGDIIRRIQNFTSDSAVATELEWILLDAFEDGYNKVFDEPSLD